jgi:hypothetical protein
MLAPSRLRNVFCEVCILCGRARKTKNLIIDFLLKICYYTVSFKFFEKSVKVRAIAKNALKYRASLAVATIWYVKANVGPTVKTGLVWQSTSATLQIMRSKKIIENSASLFDMYQDAGIEMIRVDANFTLVVGKGAQNQTFDFVPYRFGYLVCDDSSKCGFFSRSTKGICTLKTGFHLFACGCCTFRDEPEKLKTFLAHLEQAVSTGNIDRILMRKPSIAWGDHFTNKKVKWADIGDYLYFNLDPCLPVIT